MHSVHDRPITTGHDDAQHTDGDTAQQTDGDTAQHTAQHTDAQHTAQHTDGDTAGGCLGRLVNSMRFLRGRNKKLNMSCLTCCQCFHF